MSWRQSSAGCRLAAVFALAGRAAPAAGRAAPASAATACWRTKAWSRAPTARPPTCAHLSLRFRVFAELLCRAAELLWGADKRHDAFRPQQAPAWRNVPGANVLSRPGSDRHAFALLDASCLCTALCAMPLRCFVCSHAAIGSPVTAWASPTEGFIFVWQLARMRTDHLTMENLICFATDAQACNRGVADGRVGVFRQLAGGAAAARQAAVCARQRVWSRIAGVRRGQVGDINCPQSSYIIERRLMASKRARHAPDD